MHKTALKKILLFPFVLLVWFPLWFLLMGTLTGPEELAAGIGPALTGSGQAAWTLLPSYPTLEPAVKLLLDTPEYFTTYWNFWLRNLNMDTASGYCCNHYLIPAGRICQ